ncbi:MAG: hypothetical protein OHK0029_01660 [Armatimonadaceae bacterium]
MERREGMANMSSISIERESVTLAVADRTEIGRRKSNQDAVIHAEIVPGRAYLAGVADGMGGYAGGEKASATAAKHVHRLAEALRSDFPASDTEAIRLIRSRIPVLFDSIQSEIQEIAIADSGLSQMGTTLVLACVVGPCFFVVNIGDSRAYLLYTDSKGRETLLQLTQDHTVENDARRAGHRLRLETPEARRMARALTRAVRPGTPFDPELFPSEDAPLPYFQAEEGNMLLLSSDGMHGSVAEEDIEVVLREQPDLPSILERLEARALENGSTDNITTVVVSFGERNGGKPGKGFPASEMDEASRALLDSERTDGDTVLNMTPISLPSLPPRTSEPKSVPAGSAPPAPNPSPAKSASAPISSQTAVRAGKTQQNSTPTAPTKWGVRLLVLGTILIVASLIAIVILLLSQNGSPR